MTIHRDFGRRPPEWCRDCGRPLRSADSQVSLVCGMCYRLRKERAKAIKDGFEAPEPWDGWGA
jgi:hypothetical protein